MDVDLHTLLEQLSANIDNLEAALEPLIQQSFADNAAKLSSPLDRAKFHVLGTYALETILFCMYSAPAPHIHTHTHTHTHKSAVFFFYISFVCFSFFFFV
jgi:hypothetical protein